MGGWCQKVHYTFLLFPYHLPLKRVMWPFIWTNLKSLHSIFNIVPSLVKTGSIVLQRKMWKVYKSMMETTVSSLVGSGELKWVLESNLFFNSFCMAWLSFIELIKFSKICNLQTPFKTKQQIDFFKSVLFFYWLRNHRKTLKFALPSQS